MSRRRGQRRGYLYRKGPSWMLRWREDAIGSDGKLTRIQFARAIAPAEGPDALTKRQAERLAWDEVLSKLDQATLAPQSLATVSEFLTNKFFPEWVWSLKSGGKKHYTYTSKHVVAVLGKMRLRDVTTAEVQRGVHILLNSGLSVQTVTHYRNCVSALFSHAKAIGWFAGENPAAGVRLPPMQRKPSTALTVEQLRKVLDELPPAVALMVRVSAVCGLNVAELCGLEWRHINLTAQFMLMDGEAIPPFSIAVRQNHYEGKTGSLKTGSRRRIVPLDQATAAALDQHHRTTRYGAAADPVFSNKAGGKQDRKNLQQRVLMPAGVRAGYSSEITDEQANTKIVNPLGWHIFRHTAATLQEYSGMSIDDRQAMLGHSTQAMTLMYTHTNIERRRIALEKVAGLLLTPPPTQ